MRVVPPMLITDATLTSSNAAEPGPGETAWISGHTYSVGETAYQASNHTLYERLVVGGGTTSPDADTTNWTSVGPTNRWRMFDLLRNTGTTLASPLTVVLTPGVRVNSLALLGLVADRVDIDVSVNGTSVYSHTEKLSTRNVVSWYGYFFTPFTTRSSVALFDLPPYANAVITVTITRASGPVTCGSLLIGTAVYLGTTIQNAESDALNFSTIDRDFAGNSVLIPRRTVPKTSQQVRCKKSNVNVIRETRDALNAVPALWSGIDDQTSGYFDALLILGIYKRFLITLDQPEDAMIDLDLEEV